MENKVSVCALCGKQFLRNAPNQKYCSDDCAAEFKRIAQREYQREYQRDYQSREYVPRKLTKQNDNLAKAVAEYGPAGLELVQEFLNVLQKASVIAKNNKRKIDHNVIGAIMWEFRQNNVGCTE